MGESILITTLFTVVAVIEVVLAAYLLIADSRSRRNRTVAALIILFSINNISVLGMLTTFTLESAQFYHWLLIATTFSIGPAIFLTALMVLNPMLGENQRVYSFILIIALLPVAISLLDLFGRCSTPSPTSLGTVSRAYGVPSQKEDRPLVVRHEAVTSQFPSPSDSRRSSKLAGPKSSFSSDCALGSCLPGLKFFRL